MSSHAEMLLDMGFSLSDVAQYEKELKANAMVDKARPKLRTALGNKFNDISSEDHREYTFPGGHTTKIYGPLYLNVSKSGGHRILDMDGISHYIPTGWIHLQWKARDEAPHFVL